MPPAAATAAARRSHASTRRVATAVPAGPRRISGPARPARPAKPSTKRKPSSAPKPLAFRVIEGAHALSHHRWLDRMLRGRTWIAIVGVGLIGIVFMQVSMLRMNTGIGAAVERASTLERDNATLQASISQLSSSERIRNAAARAGMIPAADATDNFLDASNVNMRQAVKGITAPDLTPPFATASSSTSLAAAAAAATKEAQQTTAATTAGTTPATTGTTAPATGTTTATGMTTAAGTTTATGVATTTGTATSTGAAATGASVGSQQQAVGQTQTPQPNPATVGGGAAATGP